MTIRDEHTLRHMWKEHLHLRVTSAQFAADKKHATEEAESHERTAAAHRKTAKNAGEVGQRMANESADLADIVNEKRVELGLPPLNPGEPYPGPPVENSEQGEQDGQDGQDGQPTAGMPPESGPLPQGVMPVEPEFDPAGATRHDALQPIAQNSLPGGASA